MTSLTTSTNSRLAAEEVALLVTLGVGGLGGIAVVVLVAVQRRSLSRRIVQPVSSLAAAVRAVRDGRLDDTPSDDALPEATPKEIVGLWHDFQEMTSSLQLRRAALHRERDEARELSEIDALTGLLNRRRMSADLKAAIGSGERVSLSLIMVDIDCFKKVNDTHGHQAGDDVLRHVAAVLTTVVRGSDRVYRLGGEEFVILAPGATDQNAQDLAERVRVAIAEANEVTVSCGVASWTQQTKTSVELLARADAALYAAKRAGRNRVQVADAQLIAG